MTERLIERSFPIVQLNPLAGKDQKNKRAVYRMHSWYARRSESTFRAILLGAALPWKEGNAAVDLVTEFYDGHGDDPRLKRPDGTPMRVLDPFMGGGTTVVEALRLGFEVSAADYNPIAWFIVRGETTPVDPLVLDAAYKRVADKVRGELLELYRTTCPVTGKAADIVYGLWVKQGICVDPICGAVTDLFKSFEVARKRGDATITYIPDVQCPHCSAAFDWELNLATVTAGGPQVFGVGAAGKGRPAAGLFGFSPETSPIECPNCLRPVPISARGKKKTKRKKVSLHVLVDPTTGDFFEVRGAIPEILEAPTSGHRFSPEEAPAVGAGKFRCVKCGRTQSIASVIT